MVDHGRDATVARLEPVWRQTYLALTAGLRLADHLHNIAGWRPAADLHLHRQMTRREAMEHLKGLDPEELDDDDNFGLPMSGLLLRPSDSDVLRVWHSTDPSIPVRDSRPAREFCAQAPSRADVLPLPGLNVRTLS